ncbi:hypothetical protein MC7420_883 [Coleofasciculus chthonoplastes PCC 7420]|uniref:Uncharacterized protein n=1 Tax=Coleofasciculus chthonoplastes PCC 7420 TaxID=118168 RepID=B4VTD5_9CYAN|nr:hypothetical protein MC7420_883 [Coleofasciculus chthonoplastes PCC 7420]
MRSSIPVRSIESCDRANLSCSLPSKGRVRERSDQGIALLI